MKKNTILPAMIVLAIIASTIFLSDGLTYLITSLMALGVMGIIRRNMARVMKITRWAKANPKKAQVFITGLHITLMALGIFAGNNFKELGYEFSDTTAYVFCTISVIGFLSVPFLPKRSTIAIPQVVNRQRLAYMGIALSSFVMMVLFGNRIGDDYPNSPITYAVRAIDQAIFQDNRAHADLYDADSKPVYSENYEQALTGESSNMAVFASFTIYDKVTITSPTDLKKDARAKIKAEKKAHRLERKKARMMNRLESRLAVAAGSGAVAVILIILLLVPLCAGICLIIGAFGDATVGSVLLGIVLTGGSIWGIIKASQMSKRKK
jgi:hypothetical protein